MRTTNNLKQLAHAKLFDAEKLCRRLERSGCSLSPERPQFAAWEKPCFRFSLSIPGSWNDDLSISEVIKCLTANGLLDDSDIVHSWEAHEQWYNQLQSAFESLLDDLSNAYVSLPYELHPNSSQVSDCYVYCSDAMVIKFIEILLAMSEVSVNTDSMESQQIIMDNAVGFAVNELIPALYSDGKFHREIAAALMQKIYEHLSKLLWIYCL